jgi:hypothetical protein
MNRVMRHRGPGTRKIFFWPKFFCQSIFRAALCFADEFYFFSYLFFYFLFFLAVNILRRVMFVRRIFFFPFLAVSILRRVMFCRRFFWAVNISRHVMFCRRIFWGKSFMELICDQWIWNLGTEAQTQTVIYIRPKLLQLAISSLLSFSVHMKSLLRMFCLLLLYFSTMLTTFIWGRWIITCFHIVVVLFMRWHSFIDKWRCYVHLLSNLFMPAQPENLAVRCVPYSECWWHDVCA